MAEAVATTEAPLSSAADRPTKRAHDETPGLEQDAKRQRLSPGKTPPPAAAGEIPETVGKPEEAKDSSTEQQKEEGLDKSQSKKRVTDEKQRSKRLFGALLGNLNQPKDRTTKRRQEIEERRKAELQQQDERIYQDYQRKQERLAQQRRRQQAEIDEYYMRIKHRHMLDTAGFLRTNARPRVYYRPWELRPDEEDRIDDQIEDAQARIDDELDTVRRQQSRDGATNEDDRGLRSHSSTVSQRNAEEHERDREVEAKECNSRKEVIDVDHIEQKPINDEITEGDGANGPQSEMQDDRGMLDPAPNSQFVHGDGEKPDAILSSAVPPTHVQTRDEIDEDGDHVVEGIEDTVIY